jgi:alpha-D-ribose 1-methylphosphonate 5-triphosphate synthase subunit PhnH
MTDQLAGGFTRAEDAQSCFRQILQAMSRPGLVLELDPGIAPPAPLSVASGAALLTLIDATVSVALPEDAPAAVRDWLVFHTGARMAPPHQADFIVSSCVAELATFNPGTDDEPETGATLILDIAEFGTGRSFRLTGPGIETETILHAPLAGDFAAAWHANAARVPRGVDILLCASRSVVGLPRSVRIEEI